MLNIQCPTKPTLQSCFPRAYRRHFEVYFLVILSLCGVQQPSDKDGAQRRTSQVSQHYVVSMCALSPSQSGWSHETQ